MDGSAETSRIQAIKGMPISPCLFFKLATARCRFWPAVCWHSGSAFVFACWGVRTIFTQLLPTCVYGDMSAENSRQRPLHGMHTTAPMCQVCWELTFQCNHLLNLWFQWRYLHLENYFVLHYYYLQPKTEVSEALKNPFAKPRFEVRAFERYVVCLVWTMLH